MPIYEYTCGDCGVMFERVLPLRQAGATQSCPECDGDAERMPVTRFSPYIFRDGAPRKLPDNGKFRHYGTEVDRPIDTTVERGQHPDLIADRRGPPPLPSPEQIEEYEERRRNPEQKERTGKAIRVDAMEMQKAADLDRTVKQTARRRRLAKRRPPNAPPNARPDSRT